MMANGSACRKAGSEVELDCDNGVIGLPDFQIFVNSLGSTPGPSALVCAGEVPCTAP